MDIIGIARALLYTRDIRVTINRSRELTMADIFQFLLSVEDFLHFSGSFRDCRGAEKDRLLDNAEQALRDIVYLEPLLPDGKSVVRTVVSCMREECEV